MNYRSKLDIETWPEYLQAMVAWTICNIFGHAKPYYFKFDGAVPRCKRCNICMVDQ